MRSAAVVVFSLGLAASAAPPTPAAADNVVRYEPKAADLKYVFGVAKPVATVKRGDIIDTRTFDCFGNVIQKPGDTLDKIKGDNPRTGPFYVEGAEPGDTLAVKILELTIDSNQGVGALAPGFGALNTTSYTPMLHAPVPEKIWFYPMGVRGALLFLGDGHAQMGDGEIAGTAIEVPMHARLQVDVIKGQKIAWPRFENNREIMALGAYRPLDDALRIAFTELIGWIHNETGMSELDAYQLLSQVGKVHVTEMVDPNYVIVASIDKKFLPPRKNKKPW